jgi:hypothetical protein
VVRLSSGVASFNSASALQNVRFEETAMYAALPSIDPSLLADINGGFDFKGLAKSTFGGAVTGAAGGAVAGAMGGAMAGGVGAIPGAGAGALIGGVSGAVAGAVGSVGYQMGLF